MINQEKIKAAIDEYIANNTPPEGYYSAQEIKERIYPELGWQKVSAILEKMYRDGKVKRSENRYGRTSVWYYRFED